MGGAAAMWGQGAAAALILSNSNEDNPEGPRKDKPICPRETGRRSEGAFQLSLKRPERHSPGHVGDKRRGLKPERLLVQERSINSAAANKSEHKRMPLLVGKNAAHRPAEMEDMVAHER